jgi:hypothetical protein
MLRRTIRSVKGAKMIYPAIEDFTRFAFPEDVEISEVTIVWELPHHCEHCLNAAHEEYLLFCICQSVLGAPFPKA